MSSAKWEILNGVKFPTEEQEGSSEEIPRTEGVSGGSFVYEGSVWETIREISLEEALEFLGDKMDPEYSKHYCDMSDEELRITAFGEGIPPGYGELEGPEVDQPIMVSISSKEFQMPLGIVKTMPFLELFWRLTGADCPDEEEEMKFPDGKTYKIKLSS